MPSAERERERPAPFAALFARDLRALTASRALWAQWLVGGPLAAIALRQGLALRPGADAFESVVVPALSALSLSTAILFPFVVVRAFGRDKESGAAAIIWQLGHGSLASSLSKAFACAVAFLSSTLPALSLVAAAAVAGAHVHAASLGAVLLGYALYGALVTGIAALAAALSSGVSAAALTALVCTVGLWGLESAGPRVGGALGRVAQFTPTAALTVFQHGVVDVRLVVAQLALALGLMLAGSLLLVPAAAIETRLVRAGVVLAVALAVAVTGGQVRRSYDLTEMRKSSFPRAAADQLQRIGDPIMVTVRLRADDARYADLERDILDPLSRACTVELERVDVEDRRYGLVTYQVGTRAGESRSTQAADVVPLILDLAGLKAPPIVADGARPAVFSGSVGFAIPLAVLWFVAGAALVASRRRT
ncbi:MAG TPA: hypothetical protein VGO62_00195 [Myxococcota bacterium]